MSKTGKRGLQAEDVYAILKGKIQSGGAIPEQIMEMIKESAKLAEESANSAEEAVQEVKNLSETVKIEPISEGEIQKLYERNGVNEQ